MTESVQYSSKHNICIALQLGKMLILSENKVDGAQHKVLFLCNLPQMLLLFLQIWRLVLSPTGGWDGRLTGRD